MKDELNIDYKDCDRELTIIEEIDALSLEENLRVRIMKKLHELISINDNLITEIRDANSEIRELENAVVYLSKQVVKNKKYKEY